MTCEYNPDTNQFHVYGTILSSGNGSTFSWSDTIFSSGNKVYLKVYKVDGTYSSAGYISDQYSSPRISIPLSGGSGIYVVGSGNFCIPQILQVQEGDVFDIYYKVSLCDLTKMFGSDAGIVSALGLSSVDDITTNDGIKCCEAFERLFPQSYYAYDEGSLLSFNPTDIQTTGFNQYDNSKQTANVHVLADNKYRIKGTYTGLTYSDGSDVTITSDGYFTPDRVDRLTLTGGNDVDTCVHLSWSGYRDDASDYEKYWSVNTDLSWIRTLVHNGEVLFPNGLCKAGSVYDEISDGKAIKRIGSVDLGTLNWQKRSTLQSGKSRFEAALTGVVRPSSGYIVANLLCRKYNAIGGADVYSNVTGICAITVSAGLSIYDENFATETEENFKTAMQGVMLYYELATPIVVDLPEGINLNYRMDDFGTEEFINTTVASDTPGLCKPTLADIGYQTNLRDKIRRLDENYVSLNLQNNSESKKLTARQNIDAAATSGSYPQMTVGNLIADVDTPREFTFEETGGGGTVVGNGYADVKKVEGNTIVWNQQIQNGDFSNGLTSWSGRGSNSYISVSNGVCTVSYDGSTSSPTLYQNNAAIVQGHRYLFACKVVSTNTIIQLCLLSSSYAMGDYTGFNASSTGDISTILTCPDSTYSRVSVMTYNATTGSSFSITNVKFIDLTKMFGAGNEPTTVEEFERLFPIEYAPYCEGRLVSLGGYGIKWNQKIPIPTSSITETKGGITIVDNRNGSYTITGTPTSNFVEKDIFYGLNIVANHKYFLKISGGSKSQLSLSGYSNWNPSPETLSSKIITALNDYTTKCLFTFWQNLGELNETVWVELINLTEMFGPGSEPTLEEFEAMFGTEYCPYDEGTEMNILQKMELQGDFSVKSTGFNLWDEEWENGELDGNGNNREAAGKIRSKNYIPIIPNTVYYARTSGVCFFCFYDSNKGFIGSVQLNNSTFTTPSNAAFVRFNKGSDYGPTYNHDICINFSDPAKNGTYLPYTTSSQDLSWIYDLEYTPSGSTTSEKLFPYGLLSAGSVHDEITDTQAIKRVGVVDMGELTYEIQYNRTSTFRAKNTQIGGAVYANLICGMYEQGTLQQVYDSIDGKMYIGDPFGNGFIALFIVNSNYTDATDFKTAMNGVMLYYELAEPIIVTFPSPKDLGYNVQSGGTEQLLPSNPAGTGPITAPIIESVNYPLDAVGTLTNLPRNYISVESMDSFTTALGNALNLNISKTWDSANNKWSFSVTSRS